MTGVTNELLSELMKRIQADISDLKQGEGETRAELNAVRGTLLAVHQDVHNIYGMLGRHDERLDRIEKRLELRELAEAQSRFEQHP